jgi:hypothetical protein
MLVGALLDAGLSLSDLRDGLATLNLGGYTIQAEKVDRGGLVGTHFRVAVVDPDPPHRHLSDILELLHGSRLPARVRAQSEGVFSRLAKAEAAVHGVSVEAVHFHEVGAIDSIIDVTGVVLGLELLGVDRVYASVLSVGRGTVMTSHGLLPVPAPATARLLEGFPIREGPGDGELLTPTAAALLTHLSIAVGALPDLRVEGVGYGAGSRNPDTPNLVRVMVGQVGEEGKDVAGLEQDRVTVLEANIDDMPALVFSHVFERLFEEGALDVYTSPIGMKKSRPGVLLGAICPPEVAGRLSRLILVETTTLGVRAHDCRRMVAPRRMISVDTPYGPVRVKVGLSGEQPQVSPEYEDCRALARFARQPLKTIYDEAHRAALSVLGLR